MAEQIGKYQVLERIGRGGMGTIFKARDPMLDRLVALKVISNEVEVTDELRARFFREAQACARLTHPNIVTLYDMGEEGGRLFIVMEMLDGEELRSLIAQRKILPLEDKIAIMMQVCDGLHYAHQKGIVHRDIKPGNIMVLRDGQVKILDFGIALMTTAEMDLTRTGLIMGTLRYVSPEQIRGRADHRSDMFSVGAVFYELLSFRPPFDGADPMQILDKLCSEDPLPLRELDPSIPPELVAIVDRALRKDPGERFPDLEQMRSQLEQVLRGFTEEAQRIRASLRGRFEELRKLEGALAERVGSSKEDETTSLLDERGGLATARALEDELVARLKAGQAKMAQAESLGPAFERGLALLHGEQFEEAIPQLESIVAQMPDHWRALEGLAHARAQLDAQRQRKLAAKLVHDARTALAEQRHATCLELLEKIAAIPPPEEVIPELNSLRQSAKAALAEQEAAKHAQQRAERARDRMLQARTTAETQAAAQYGPDLWNDAESKAAEAQAALARQAPAEAEHAFDAAAATYKRSEEAAREANLQLLETLKRARQEMSQAQQRAREAGAAEHARTLWGGANAKSADAQVAFTKNDLLRAEGRFAEAVALYRQAEEAAIEVKQRQLRQAEEARIRMEQGQSAAAAMDAEHHAAALWEEAAAKVAAGEFDVAQEQYAKAADTFDEALVLYRRAANEAEKTRTRHRDQIEEVRRAIAEARARAAATDAPLHAPSEWREAEAIVAASEAAFLRETYSEARRGFDRGVALYRLAEERAQHAIHVLEIAATEAATARREAAEAEADKYAVEEWRAGEASEAQANSAHGRQEYADARSLFAESRKHYAVATQMATAARQAEASRVATMLADAQRLFASGDVSACLRLITELLELKPGHAVAEDLRRQAEAKQQQGEAVAHHAATSAELVLPRQVDVPRALPNASAIRAEAPTDDRTILQAPTVAVPSSTREGSATTAREASKTEADPTAPKAQWSHWRLAMVSAGGLAALGLGAVLWLERSVPPGQPSVPQATVAATPVSPTLPDKAAPQIVPTPAATGTASPPVADSATAVEGSLLHKREVEEAGQARTAAARARNDAERVSASSRASRTFALAQQKEREAEAALGGQDAASAKLQFQNAQQAYKQATQEAEREAAGEEKQRVATLQRQQADADQARDRMTAARRTAEQAGASQYAAKMLASAQSKERDAGTALGRSDYGAAARSFRDAESDYQAAAQEAKRESEAQGQLAMLKTSVEQWRSRTSTRRDEAVKTEANRLAKDVFDAAQAKQAEAEGLVGRQNYSAASFAYQDAAERYMEATRRAERVREAKAQAESARTSMLARKEQADATSSDFANGLAEERQGNTLYERLAYREAIESFKSAEVSFAKAGVKSPPAPLPPPKPDSTRRRPLPPSF